MKGNFDIDNKTIRQLIDSYFEATISEEDTLRLLDVALKMEDIDVVSPEDERMLSDLRLFVAINSIPAPECTEMPDGLASRLDNHISRLDDNRRKRLWIRIRKATAVAAAIAGIAVCAIGFMKPTQIDSIASADSLSILPELNLSIPEENAAQLAETVAGTESPASPKVIPSSPAPKTAKSVLSAKASISDSNPHKIEIPGLDEITKINLPAIQVNPAIAMADFNPMSKLVSPLTTVSSSIDCVYESLSMVQKALSGVKTTLGEASDEVMAATSVTLRSI